MNVIVIHGPSGAIDILSIVNGPQVAIEHAVVVQVVKGDEIIFESGNTASARSEDRVVNNVDRVGSREYPAFIRASIVNDRNDIVGSSVAGRTQEHSMPVAELNHPVLI